MTDWQQQIEAQIEAQRELAKEHQMLRGFSVILDSEDRAVLRNTADSLQVLLDVAVAAGAMREDYERYGYVRNKGYVNPLHDEKILRAYDDALDKLREVGDV